MAETLSTELAHMPIPRIVRFHRSLLAKCEQSLSWQLLGKGGVIHRGSCSEDSFCYFRLWAIGQGRDVFEKAATGPDWLADVAKLRSLAAMPITEWPNDDFPHLESLLYASEMAHDRVLGKLSPDAGGLTFVDELRVRSTEIPDANMPADFSEGPASDGIPAARSAFFAGIVSSPDQV